MKNSLKNLEVFTQALARNSEKIDNVMVKVDGVMAKADNLMLGLNAIAGGNNGSELNLMVKVDPRARRECRQADQSPDRPTAAARSPTSAAP